MAHEKTGIAPEAAFEHQLKNFHALKREPVSRRKERLRALKNWIHANRMQLQLAAHQDLGKPATEFDATEILFVLSEIKEALKNLDRWASPLKVTAPLHLLGTRSQVVYEPRGVCLIISPWNYPFGLCIGPLVSALAAGNAVILKPSELAPHIADQISHMAEAVFDPAVVTVLEGGVEMAQTLLQLPFNHIFFTGSPVIGKIVMKGAAEHLASVTLELGGKSPVVVTASAHIREAAQRIAISKFINAGQTCVAPDYVLADESIAAALTEEIIRHTRKFFTEEGMPFQKSPHYARIINPLHFDRLHALTEDAIHQNCQVSFSGEHNRNKCFFHPTIITHVPPSARIMQEEIFGPILPIITYSQLNEALDIINTLPRPLALYIFSQSTREQQTILKETSSGGVCINECAVHFLQNNLPFGGVNNSGIGNAHGRYGFIAFSHEKAVLKQRNGWAPIKLFYPPYTIKVRKLMDWLLKLF